MGIGEGDLKLKLPAHLAERTRSLSANGANSGGEYVLYWLHHAMRAAENPALDVAISVAHELNLPVLVYQSLPESYPYASDRHHTFVLQGARDLQQQFASRGIRYAFHLERNGDRGGYLPNLAEKAAGIITEDHPIEPFRTWAERLAATVSAPVYVVDTACVVPMKLVGKAYERAFEFRKATRSLYEERLTKPWPMLDYKNGPANVDLPFQTLDLQSTDFASILSECEIDHTIAPVHHTRGGSTNGYDRWNGFKEAGLTRYAQRRNNPLIDGTSRLSPYLHYGMVSPMRIAREAAEFDNRGAEKFLDELLIWRELAYVFCFNRRDHGTLDAIPDWAQATLAASEADPRSTLMPWEVLARAKTGDALWDACQLSLLIHGELHNNVRMTWGKALLKWTPNPQTALALLIDLNHRYALDGNDPASYGGLLWCLGQFDRPFTPPSPIRGTVRGRSTTEHAKRLDVDQYRERTSRPLWQSQHRVAVIGAGLSGLMCARTLSDHGMAVTVFEKSRGVGGRMATRRNQQGDRFDHGAQYFTVRDERFGRYVSSWWLDKIVAPWEGKIATLTRGTIDVKETTEARYVACPTMNALCKHLASDLDVKLQTQVQPPERNEDLWNLTDDKGQSLGAFDVVVSSAPAAQSAQLLQSSPELQAKAQQVTMQGCWAVLVAFEKRLDLDFDGAFVQESPLSWIARNSSKPRRDAKENWVLHASPDWSTDHIEEEAEHVLRQLLQAFWQATGLPAQTPAFATSHRWRMSIPENPLATRSLYDPQLRLGACGDWCSGPRVEGAFLSGSALAGQILRHASQEG